MSSTVMNNSHQRKTLATQLDRLDVILDGLADGMQDAVALTMEQVVGEVVRKAVEAAVREVLTNPDILAALSRKVSEPSSPPPQKASWSVKEALKGAGAWLAAETVRKVSQTPKVLGLAWKWCLSKLGGACARIAGGCTLVTQAGRMLWQFRRSGGAALSVGLLAGVGSYLAGPVVAAIMCGLSGLMLTGSALILVPLARILWLGEASEV